MEQAVRMSVQGDGTRELQGEQRHSRRRMLEGLSKSVSFRMKQAVSLPLLYGEDDGLRLT